MNLKRIPSKEGYCRWDMAPERDLIDIPGVSWQMLDPLVQEEHRAGRCTTWDFRKGRKYLYVKLADGRKLEIDFNEDPDTGKPWINAIDLVPENEQ